MENQSMKVNALSGYTFGWLKMNAASLQDLPAFQKLSPAIELPEGVRVEKVPEALQTEIRTGSGEDLGKRLLSAGIPTLSCTVPAGTRVPEEDALRLYFDLPDAGESYDPKGRRNQGPVPAAAGRFAAVSLSLEEASDLTVVMDVSSEAEAKGLAGVQTRIRAGKGASLRLIQILRPGAGYSVLNDVGAVLSEGASLQVIHLILGGQNIWQGLSAELVGDRAKLSADIGYIGRDSARYDMNYEAVHLGKKTSCEIHANGVLRDSACKLFRDTIDFRNGCSGAIGEETEDVLLMDETVHNKSIPIILCAEEDVVGNHGATIGRLDEHLLFYMESRGMQREEIYEMMAKARIDALIRRIPDVKTRCDLLDQRMEEV